MQVFATQSSGLSEKCSVSALALLCQRIQPCPCYQNSWAKIRLFYEATCPCQQWQNTCSSHQRMEHTVRPLSLWSSLAHALKIKGPDLKLHMGTTLNAISCWHSSVPIFFDTYYLRLQTKSLLMTIRSQKSVWSIKDYTQNSHSTDRHTWGIVNI